MYCCIRVNIVCMIYDYDYDYDYCYLTGLTRSIKDEHSRADETTPKTSPRKTRMTDENRVAIQCLQ